MEYRCETDTIEGFVQQLASSYLPHGYYFYVWGIVPEGKNPELVDQKLVSKYELSTSKWVRARRKRAGLGNVAYLRHERFFVLVATHGRHRFFEEEAAIEDFRRRPLRFASYALSHRGGHAHVRIAEPTYKDLKAYFEDVALRRPAAWLGERLGGLPFEPYAPVRRQLLSLLRSVNRRRTLHGLDLIPSSALRFRRRIVFPFGARSSRAA